MRLDVGVLRLPLGVDGRTRDAKTFRRIVLGLVAEAGPLGAAEAQLARRFAALSVECERLEARALAGEQIDAQHLASLALTLSRLRSKLRRARRARS